LVQHDPLTGLPGRGLLGRALQIKVTAIGVETEAGAVARNPD
jgi:hypothetical protein